jgi:hypothetical protein
VVVPDLRKVVGARTLNAATFDAPTQICGDTFPVSAVFLHGRLSEENQAFSSHRVAAGEA